MLEQLNLKDLSVKSLEKFLDDKFSSKKSEIETNLIACFNKSDNSFYKLSLTDEVLKLQDYSSDSSLASNLRFLGEANDVANVTAYELAVKPYAVSEKVFSSLIERGAIAIDQTKKTVRMIDAITLSTPENKRDSTLVIMTFKSKTHTTFYVDTVATLRAFFNACEQIHKLVNEYAVLSDSRLLRFTETKKSETSEKVASVEIEIE